MDAEKHRAVWRTPSDEILLWRDLKELFAVWKGETGSPMDSELKRIVRAEITLILKELEAAARRPGRLP